MGYDLMELQGDIKLYYTDYKPGDLEVSGSDLVNEPGLENAVLISILTDRRADNEDILPNIADTKRGWWADNISSHKIGSRLWILGRHTINNTTLAEAKQYTEECLAWQISDGVADQIIVTVERASNKNTTNTEIIILRENLDSIYFQYTMNWESQIIKGDS
jgi:phage gp46-like protein